MTDNIKDIINRLQKLMYGLNYEVCFGVDIFEGETEQDFKKKIINKYPETNPEKYPLTELSRQELVEEIGEYFDYRGDSGAGLTLTEAKEIELKLFQKKYFDFVNQYINANSKFYYYSDPNGIPGYPVFWEYRFVIFCDNKTILFIYGSASD